MDLQTTEWGARWYCYFTPSFNDKIEFLKQENRELKNSISELESEKRALKRDLHETNNALNDIHNRLTENENMSKSTLA